MYVVVEMLYGLRTIYLEIPIFMDSMIKDMQKILLHL